MLVGLSKRINVDILSGDISINKYNIIYKEGELMFY
jgi:hypothetical protein